jgi:AAA ATPase domain
MDNVFIGREAELGVLDRALGEVVAGTYRVVSVEASAGVGKTALLRAFRTRHSGIQEYVASADESEAALPFGIIDQWLSQVHRTRPETLPDQLRSDASGWDPLQVGAGLLELLGQVQDRGPVLLLLLEDAHWADPPSLQALTFTLRRLQADQVLAVLSIRPEHVERLPPGLQRLLESEHGRRLVLHGLSAADVRQLAERAGHPLTLHAAQRLQEQTVGKPAVHQGVAHRARAGRARRGHGRTIAATAAVRPDRTEPAGGVPPRHPCSCPSWHRLSGTPHPPAVLRLGSYRAQALRMRRCEPSGGRCPAPPRRTSSTRRLAHGCAPAPV